MKVLPSTIFVCLLALSIIAQSKPDPEYRSYLAHIAAASQSLRLYDTAEAKRWLASAPVKYRGWEWHYLNGQSDQSGGTFSNGDAVTAMAIGPGGKLIATTFSDRSVRLLEAATGAEILKKTDEKMIPQSVAFGPDGKCFAAAYSRHAVRVWAAALRPKIGADIPPVDHLQV